MRRKIFHPLGIIGEVGIIFFFLFDAFFNPHLFVSETYPVLFTILNSVQYKITITDPRKANEKLYPPDLHSVRLGFPCILFYIVV